jgi:hypothetical protein
VAPDEGFYHGNQAIAFRGTDGIVTWNDAKALYVTRLERGGVREH